MSKFLRILIFLFSLNIYCLPSFAQVNVEAGKIPIYGGEGSFSVLYENKIFIFGGYNIYLTDDIVLFDPVTAQSEIVGNLPHKMGFASAAVLDNKIYIFGGLSKNIGKDEIFDDILCYDPKNSSITIVGHLPTPMSYTSATELNGKLYVTGGDKIICFDPKTGNSTVVSYLPSTRDFASSVSLDGKLYIIGGRDFSGYYTQVLCYNPPDNKTTISKSLPSGNKYFTSFTGNNSIYIVGEHIQHFDDEILFTIKLFKYNLSNNELIDLTSEIGHQEPYYIGIGGGGEYDNLAINDRVYYLNGRNTVLFLNLPPKESVRKIDIYINGTKIKFDSLPYLKDGRTMVPFRPIAEALGCTVNWDPIEKEIITEMNGSVIKFFTEKKTAYINQKSMELDVPPEVIDGRTYVPLRFLSETFGYKVYWDDSNNKVTIDTKN